MLFGLIETEAEKKKKEERYRNIYHLKYCSTLSKTFFEDVQFYFNYFLKEDKNKDFKNLSAFFNSSTYENFASNIDNRYDKVEKFIFNFCDKNFTVAENNSLFNDLYWIFTKEDSPTYKYLNFLRFSENFMLFALKYWVPSLNFFELNTLREIFKKQTENLSEKNLNFMNNEIDKAIQEEKSKPNSIFFQHIYKLNKFEVLEKEQDYINLDQFLLKNEKYFSYLNHLVLCDFLSATIFHNFSKDFSLHVWRTHLERLVIRIINNARNKLVPGSGIYKQDIRPYEFSAIYDYILGGGRLSIEQYHVVKLLIEESADIYYKIPTKEEQMKIFRIFSQKKDFDQAYHEMFLEAKTLLKRIDPIIEYDNSLKIKAEVNKKESVKLQIQKNQPLIKEIYEQIAQIDSEISSLSGNYSSIQTSANSAAYSTEKSRLDYNHGGSYVDRDAYDRNRNEYYSYVDSGHDINKQIGYLNGIRLELSFYVGNLEKGFPPEN